MNEITCELCMDLLPLVLDGVASPDSNMAVEHHLASCNVCREHCHDKTPPPIDTYKSWEKIHFQLQISFGTIMMLGIFFGLSLTTERNIFYNTLIMPIIGLLGYIIFQKKALYCVPILILITHCFTNFFCIIRDVEHLKLRGLLISTFLYSIFSIIGTVIGILFQYAFRKDCKK